jgi:hypothetical protein
MEPDVQKCEREPTRAPRRDPETLHHNSTAPQVAGLSRHLELAQAQVHEARDYQTRRQAQRYANSIKRALRPAPIDGSAAAAEAIRNSQVLSIVAWAERQSGGAR